MPAKAASTPRRSGPPSEMALGDRFRCFLVAMLQFRAERCDLMAVMIVPLGESCPLHLTASSPSVNPAHLVSQSAGVGLSSKCGVSGCCSEKCLAVLCATHIGF